MDPTIHPKENVAEWGTIWLFMVLREKANQSRIADWDLLSPFVHLVLLNSALPSTKFNITSVPSFLYDRRSVTWVNHALLLPYQVMSYIFLFDETLHPNPTNQKVGSRKELKRRANPINNYSKQSSCILVSIQYPAKELCLTFRAHDFNV